MTEQQKEIEAAIDNFLLDTEDTGEYEPVVRQTVQASHDAMDSFLSAIGNDETVPVWMVRLDQELEHIGDLNEPLDLVELAELLEG